MHPNLRAMVPERLPPLITLALPRHPRTRIARPAFASALPVRSIHTSLPLRPRHDARCSSSAVPRRINPVNTAISTQFASRSIASTAKAPGEMFRMPAPEPGADFNVVMIGAGVCLLSFVVRALSEGKMLTYRTSCLVRTKDHGSEFSSICSYRC